MVAVDYILRSFLDIIPSSTKTAAGQRIQVTACMYLLGLFVFDYMQWGVSKLMRQEVLEVAIELGYSEVRTSLVLSTCDTIMSFLAGLAAPRLAVKFLKEKYPIVTAETLTCQQLAEFSYLAYFFSTITSLVFYSILCGVLMSGILTDAVLVWFIVAWTIQYPWFNQLGDQTIEMGVPHWDNTFAGTELKSPRWLGCLDLFSVPATPRTLSLFALLIKAMIFGFAVMLYSALNDDRGHSNNPYQSLTNSCHNPFRALIIVNISNTLI